MFLRAAEQAGIEINITGKLPENAAVKNLMIIGAVEALVNAVRHAEATMLSMELTDDETFTTVRYTNNGKKPTVQITEGGGLSSLRNKVTNLGGQMTIEAEPEFSLTISVPNERSEK
jgi:signal transduction histidine kinase